MNFLEVSLFLVFKTVDPFNLGLERLKPEMYLPNEFMNSLATIMMCSVSLILFSFSDVVVILLVIPRRSTSAQSLLCFNLFQDYQDLSMHFFSTKKTLSFIVSDLSTINSTIFDKA